jgi:dCTP deaminase
MTLPDHEIEAAVRSHNLGIEPFNEEQLQPASYDLRLDRYFRRVRGAASEARLVDPAKDQDWTVEAHPVHRGGRPMIGLEPNKMLLASTVERIRMPAHLVARVEGKSSLARLGLFVHVTAGFIDPGFEGHITLELYCGNGRGIILYPGMPIAQIAFDRMDSPPRQVYAGKYQGSNEPGPVPSRYHQNFPLKEMT